MAEVQTPLAAAAPAVAQPSRGDKDALITRLDTLLEQYLHALDAYETLTQQLSKQLSSAYFSLTQANFHNRSGVPYGRDRYDERVRATRKIVVTEDAECRLRFASHSPLDGGLGSGGNPSPEAEGPAPGDGQSEEESGGGAEESAEAAGAPVDADDVSDAEKSDAKNPTLADPIRMFGILVPPALRAAQMSFNEAVDGPVVGLAGVTAELRALEREIGRVRKGIRKA